MIGEVRKSDAGFSGLVIQGIVRLGLYPVVLLQVDYKCEARTSRR